MSDEAMHISLVIFLGQVYSDKQRISLYGLVHIRQPLLLGQVNYMPHWLVLLKDQNNLLYAIQCQLLSVLISSIEKVAYAIGLYFQIIYWPRGLVGKECTFTLFSFNLKGKKSAILCGFLIIARCVHSKRVVF